MKKSFFLNLLLVIFCFTLSIAQETYTVETIPNPKTIGQGWVSDHDNFLSEEEKQELNQQIDKIEDNTTVQIAIVIVQSIGQAVPKDFATRLFQQWGIGQSEKDNGLLILTVIDQRRTEMETGYGLEGILPDAICYRIASQEFVPYFKKGEYGKGLIQGISRIKQIVENPKTIDEIIADNGVTYRQPDNDKWYFFFSTYFLLMLFFLYQFAVSVLQIDHEKADFYDKYIHLKSKNHLLYSIFFPIPFIFIYLLFTKNRLSKYRKAKRYSKLTGEELFPMDEKIDDVFLENGQIIEEEIGSVDYDVWVTQELDDLLILRYDNKSKYSECKKCHYKTYYKDHSKIVSAATTSHSGITMLTFKCKSCGFTESKKIISPRRTSSSSYSGGSSFSGGSSSSSGSSFGGGSSGGGGAGVSW